MKLRSLAPGKVNLGLFVGPPRPDGRHEIVTAIESVSLADELTLSTEPGADSDVVTCPGVGASNLVADGLAALRNVGWQAPPVHIEINKRVPVAGGMAGGSADVGALLRMAMALDELQPGQAAQIAASLGSDIPSQLAPGLVLATGSGDVIEAREPLATHAFVLVPVQSELSTAQVYAKADELELPRTPNELRRRGEELDQALKPGSRLPTELLVNDLERATLALREEVADVLNEARAGAVDDAVVCGSGPTVAGLFWGEDASDRAVAAAAQLIELYPGTIAAVPVGGDFGMVHQI